MRGTQQRQGLAGYRDSVTELIEAGEPFGHVEDAIDQAADLTLDQKGALFAFSLRAPSEQQRDARAHLAFVQ